MFYKLLFFWFSHKISDLKPGWNRQFLMMKEFGFVYDSSIPAPLSDPPLWPYTLDYKIPHKCIGRRKCPSRSFPGIWVNNFFLNTQKFFKWNFAKLCAQSTNQRQKKIREIDLFLNFTKNKIIFFFCHASSW